MAQNNTNPKNSDTMEDNNIDTEKSNTFKCNTKWIIVFIIILIFFLIVVGCLVAWNANFVLLNNLNDPEKLKRVRESLMSVNTITFLVTLIVGLLASLLLYRIDRMESLVNKYKKLLEKNKEIESKISADRKSIQDLLEKNEGLESRISDDSKSIQDLLNENKGLESQISDDSKSIQDLLNENKGLESQISNYISKNIGFDVMLLHATDIHFLVNLMNTIAIQIPVIEDNNDKFEEVGDICSRIVPIAYYIQIALDRKELSFTKTTIEKKEILNTYVDDILDLLERISSSIKKTQRSRIYENVDKIYNQMHDIQEQIKKIPIEDED